MKHLQWLKLESYQENSKGHRYQGLMLAIESRDPQPEAQGEHKFRVTWKVHFMGHRPLQRMEKWGSKTKNDSRTNKRRQGHPPLVLNNKVPLLLKRG